MFVIVAAHVFMGVTVAARVVLTVVMAARVVVLATVPVNVILCTHVDMVRTLASRSVGEVVEDARGDRAERRQEVGAAEHHYPEGSEPPTNRPPRCNHVFQASDRHPTTAEPSCPPELLRRGDGVRMPVSTRPLSPGPPTVG